MKLEISKNASAGIIFGILSKFYQIFVPFFMRTALIRFMGVQYLGLNSLFTSILQVLNLAELGVGSAMVYSMYKPIAEEDTITICALEKLYRTYCNLIGGVIAITGLLITPVIPKLISGQVPSDINIYVLYFLNLGATVLSYWLFAYKNSLFLAHQRTDITSKIAIMTTTVQYALQLFVIIVMRDYYCYLMISLLSQVLNNCMVAIRANRMYPYYKPQGRLPRKHVKEINGRIKDLFTVKLGSTVVNYADTLVLSSFLGLTALAMYQNYYFVMNAVMGIVTTIFSSFLAGVGNSIAIESREKNYYDFEKITFSTNWIAIVCVCCFACLYQPFMKIWMGEEFLFDYSVVILFCVYFYLVTMQQIAGMYKDAAGVWHQDRFRPLIVAMVNLTLNLMFIKKWGIYAILLSTILSYIVISVPWLAANVFRYIFQRSAKQYVKNMLRYIVQGVFITGVCIFLCAQMHMKHIIFELFANGCVAVVISNVSLFVMNKRNVYFKELLAFIDVFTRGKMRSVFARLGFNAESQ